MPHGGDKHHHQPKVNLGPQKTNRGGSVAFSAAFTLTTKTQAAKVGIDPGPPGFSGIVGYMQPAATVATSLLPAFFRKFLIAFGQEIQYVLICRETGVSLFFLFFSHSNNTRRDGPRWNISIGGFFVQREILRSRSLREVSLFPSTSVRRNPGSPLIYRARSQKKLCFHPSSKALAVGTKGPAQNESLLFTVSAINLSDRSEVCNESFSGKPGDAMLDISFLENGQITAGCGSLYRGGTIKLIDSKNQKQYPELELRSITSTGGGRWYIFQSKEGGYNILDNASGKSFSTPHINNQNVVEANIEGTLLAIAKNDTLSLVDLLNANRRELPSAGGQVIKMRFSVDGQYLVVATEKNLIIIDTEKLSISDSINIGSYPNSLVIGNGGYSILVGGQDGILRIFELGKLSPTLRRPRLGQKFTANDSLFAIRGKNDNTAVVVDPSRWQIVSSFSFPEKIESLLLSEKKTQLAIGGTNKLALYSLSSGQQLWDVPVHYTVADLDFHSKSNSIAIGLGAPDISFDAKKGGLSSESGALQVRRLNNGYVKLGNQESSKYPFPSVQFSPDGSKLAYGIGGIAQPSWFCTIDSKTGKELISPEFIGNGIHEILFDRMQDRVFIASGNHFTNMFDFAQNKITPIAKLRSAVISLGQDSSRSLLFALTLDGYLTILDSGNLTVIGNIRLGDGASWDEEIFFDGATQTLTVGSSLNDLKFIDYRFFSFFEQEYIKTWTSFLYYQGGTEVSDINGTLLPLSNAKWMELTAKKPFSRSSIEAGKLSETDKVIAWFLAEPHLRTITPWKAELLGKVVGRQYLTIEGNDVKVLKSIYEQAPWHPLAPIALALTLQSPQSNRIHSLANITVTRLKYAESNQFSPQEIVDYSTWAANILGNRLKLYEDAYQVMDIAKACQSEMNTKELDISVKGWPVRKSLAEKSSADERSLTTEEQVIKSIETSIAERGFTKKLDTGLDKNTTVFFNPKFPAKGITLLYRPGEEFELCQLHMDTELSEKDANELNNLYLDIDRKISFASIGGKFMSVKLNFKRTPDGNWGETKRAIHLFFIEIFDKTARSK